MERSIEEGSESYAIQKESENKNRPDKSKETRMESEKY